MNATDTLDDALLLGWLREDAPHGDLSTSGLPLAGRAGQMQFSARQALCVAGSEEAARLLQLAGAQVQLLAASGTALAAGAPLLQAQGPAPALLLGWKVAQTLVEAASGIANATAAIVGALRAAGYTLPLACTRKTFPGTRALAAKAVRAGGGVMHRLGLSETLLVFPEHRVFLSATELTAALSALRQSQPEKRLVVEVGNDADALALARAGADVLVSSAPYFAPPAEVQVRITPVA
jgi:molybdenum transport protein